MPQGFFPLIRPGGVGAELQVIRLGGRSRVFADQLSGKSVSAGKNLANTGIAFTVKPDARDFPDPNRRVMRFASVPKTLNNGPSPDTGCPW